jgi:hypothetical protein
MSPYQNKQSTDEEASEKEGLKSDGNQELTALRTADVAKTSSSGNAETGEVVEKEKQSEEDSRESAKILLELDLEAEVALNAKIKGDVTVGLT